MAGKNKTRKMNSVDSAKDLKYTSPHSVEHLRTPSTPPAWAPRVVVRPRTRRLRAWIGLDLCLSYRRWDCLPTSQNVSLYLCLSIKYRSVVAQMHTHAARVSLSGDREPRGGGA